MWWWLAACADNQTEPGDSAISEAPPPTDTGTLPNRTEPVPDPTTSTVTTYGSRCAVDRWDPADFTTVIDVGAGHAAATPSDIPWESLGPDTLVRIWPGVYHDKWILAVTATEADPFVVIGVCDPVSGALPVIDGASATTRLALDFWSETRGVVKIGGGSTPSATPAWVYLEDLEIRGGRSTASFFDDAGNEQTYADNAAAVYVEMGEHVTIRGCTLTDSGNGLFVSHQSQHVTVFGNRIWDNGNVGSIYEHNNYSEANGITFEANWFGPLCDGCAGNNLKDRSAGTVIRYNWIEGGNRQLDLVDSEYPDIHADPSYRETFVYGNVLLEPDGDGNSQIIHYGGDSGNVATYRRGTLHLYHNTIVSERVTNTTWVRLSDSEETVDARNNLVWAVGPLAILNGGGTTTLRSNWLVEWVESFDVGNPGTVIDEGTNQVGTDPGLTNLANHQLTPTPYGAVVDLGGALATGASPVTHQYAVHQDVVARPDDGAPDAGAFEVP